MKKFIFVLEIVKTDDEMTLTESS